MGIAHFGNFNGSEVTPDDKRPASSVKFSERLPLLRVARVYGDFEISISFPRNESFLVSKRSDISYDLSTYRYVSRVDRAGCTRRAVIKRGELIRGLKTRILLPTLSPGFRSARSIRFAPVRFFPSTLVIHRRTISVSSPAGARKKARGARSTCAMRRPLTDATRGA